jgi:hypothetical protein
LYSGESLAVEGKYDDIDQRCRSFAATVAIGDIEVNGFKITWFSDRENVIVIQ